MPFICAANGDVLVAGGKTFSCESRNHLVTLTSGAVTRTYTYGLQRISEDQIVSNTWTPSFYSYDGGGNVRALTNTAGARP
jgi:hypothetical protein